MSNRILHDHQRDGIDRRGFLECMAWVGTGVLWTMAGGILSSRTFGQPTAPGMETGKGASPMMPPPGDFHFVQISDSHIGFNKAANPDVTATLREAIARINALPVAPAFVLHTGDLTHLAEAGEFDILEQELKRVRTEKIFYVPGEHDIRNDDGSQFRERFGRNGRGDGWYSYDYRAVHFIGLVNVINISEDGLGVLGEAQLEWLERDVAHLSADTPIVVFAHVPLWMVYPEWGWGTSDGARALGHLKRFGSVTVLNGHIHQTVQKIEGNMTFHTATSTAFVQPKPGTAPKPGPMKVEAGELKKLLGLTSVNYVQNTGALAIVDTPLLAPAAGMSSGT